MVDASGLEGDILDRLTNLLRQHPRGTLHTVAEADRRDPERGQVPAVHRHRVRVVDQQRVRTDFKHVARDLGVGGSRAQEAEDAAGSQRVADPLVDPVGARDLHIVPVDVKPANHEGDDHVGRAGQRFPPIVGRLDRRRKPVVLGEIARGDRRPLRSSPIQIHQRVRCPAQRREGQHVAHQSERKDDPTRADDRDLRSRSACWLIGRSCFCRCRNHDVRRSCLYTVARPMPGT